MLHILLCFCVYIYTCIPLSPFISILMIHPQPPIQTMAATKDAVFGVCALNVWGLPVAEKFWFLKGGTLET